MPQSKKNIARELEGIVNKANMSRFLSPFHHIDEYLDSVLYDTTSPKEKIFKDTFLPSRWRTFNDSRMFAESSVTVVVGSPFIHSKVVTDSMLFDAILKSCDGWSIGWITSGANIACRFVDLHKQKHDIDIEAITSGELDDEQYHNFYFSMKSLYGEPFYVSEAPTGCGHEHPSQRGGPAI